MRPFGHGSKCMCERCMPLPPLKKREKTFERALRDALGELGVMFVKLKPTIEGFPDRLAIGFGNMKLVEAKSKDGTLSEVQKILHKDLTAMGVEVIVLRHDVRSATQTVCRALRER